MMRKMTIKNLSKWIFSLAAIGALLSWYFFVRKIDEVKTDTFDTQVVTVEKRGVTLRTNSWFSSLYRQFPSAPLFVFPGAYQLNDQGLALSDSQVVATENTIFGSFSPVCTVLSPSALSGASVQRYGDWDVLIETRSKDDKAAWSVHLSQGSPVAKIENFFSDLALNCTAGVAVSKYRDDALLIRRGELPIMIVQSQSSVPDVSQEAILRSLSGEYRIVQLPSRTTQAIDFFLDLPWVNVLDTKYSWSKQDDQTRFRLTTITENNTTGLITVWPHHRLGGARLTSEPIGSYTTIYGELELHIANQIDMSPENLILESGFDAVTDAAKRERIKGLIREDSNRFLQETPPTGVYFLGTWLGGLATLIELAEAYEVDDEREKLLDLLEARLRMTLAGFSYDDEKKMYIARTNPEFGNEKGNDHHFHYGYYLRSAAVLFSARPKSGDDLKAVLDEMAFDIATSDRSSDRYPFLRHFSPYTGHSWADGEALFQDGNNQESSSEAMNAWYGLYLWGKAVKNSQFSETGESLYSHELLGLRSYWFGENNPFPAGFEHAMISLVWGGKRDYATWFSADPMHIQGIQWLPITPASKYLGILPNHVERMRDLGLTPSVAANHEWGDLYAAYLSYFDPVEAEKHLETASKNQAIKSKALLYHTVLKNLERQ